LGEYLHVEMQGSFDAYILVTFIEACYKMFYSVGKYIYSFSIKKRVKRN